MRLAQVDLKPGGRSLDVTDGNKAEYVYLVATWRCRHCTALEMDALLDGCADVGVVPDLLAPFGLDELGLLFNGRRDVDLDEVQAYSLHQGPPDFDASHVVSIWFLPCVQENPSTSLQHDFVRVDASDFCV